MSALPKPLRVPPGAVLANGLILSALALAGALNEIDPDRYYRLVQEDEALEWTTFWLFIAAGIAFGRQASLRWAEGLRSVWLPAGIALFCVTVAMEEISWGQRLIGFRPPTYFLEHNFQQELNVHNVAGRWLRKAVLLGILLGYGVALPLLALVPRARALLERVGIGAPPLVLAPSFVVMAIVHLAYPWSHTGEWIEHTLAAALLFAAILAPEAAGPARAPTRSLGSVAGAWAMPVVLGVVTAQAWWVLREGMPENITAARIELEALRTDLARPQVRSRCGTHKRVYGFVRKYEQEHMLSGAFAELRGAGLPPERAEFFLDPWNSPYWFRHICSDDRTRRAIYVYSFGPNRLRDSLPWEIIPDDLAAFVIHPAPRPEPEGR